MHPPLRERITIMPTLVDHPAAARLRDKLSPYSDELTGKALERVAKKSAPVVHNKTRENENLEHVREPDSLARALDFVSAVGSCSPYLHRLMSKSPATVLRVLNDSPEKVLDQACAMALAASEQDTPEAQASVLRHAKDLAALVIALSELSGAWSTMEAAEKLSDFADAAVAAATKMALVHLIAKGFVPEDSAHPEIASGIVVIAMGKHGARELNYSSDIDLVFLFDGDAKTLRHAPRHLTTEFVKIVCHRLSDQTRDGYVFRTDIRLRPDPGSSAPAVSIAAAEAYYEAYGQNWERAAFIKARPVAGDLALGARFMAMMTPFIWRKYLDYAAIDDIHSIVRQLRGHRELTGNDLQGHDIKTGWGGIREVEFFVQTQQLVLGGKNNILRQPRTLQSMKTLFECGTITKEAYLQLANCYESLRQIEHRIQMLADEQTHKIPVDDEELCRVSALSGFANVEEFKERIYQLLSETNAIFTTLFDRESSLGGDYGALSFTGVDHDERTLNNLSAMGFDRPKDVAGIIRQWHAGDLRATRMKRGRELLTELTPWILSSLAKSKNPSAAFISFDNFLRELPSGVQIFSLFANNPSIFTNLNILITISPSMGRLLAQNPELIEMLVDGDWSGARAEINLAEIDNLSDSGEDFERTVNAIRRWGVKQKFMTSALLLLEKIEAATAADNFTRIADAAIARMLPLARQEMTRLYGDIEGTCAVIGLGRLGIRRMTASSDVDLIFVYDAPSGARSTGTRSLSAADFFLRMMRRFLSLLTAPGVSPPLFEVDMALRPSGGAGPAAVSLSAFSSYYFDTAWTWEIMAMTKARIISGDHPLTENIKNQIGQILRLPRLPAKISADVIDMRARLHRLKPGKNCWDVKNRHGGITDIEFAFAYLLLCRLPAGHFRDVSTPFSYDIFAALLDPVRAADERHQLILAADTVFENVIQIARAAGIQDINIEKIAPAVTHRLCNAFGFNDIRTLEAYLSRTQMRIEEITTEILNDEDPNS